MAKAGTGANRAVNLGEIDANAYRLFQNGDFKAAGQLYTELLKLAPNHPHVLHMLGTIAYHNADYKKSIDLIKKAIRFRDTDFMFYTNLGNAYNESGDSVKALYNYKKALSLNPDHSVCHYNVASLYHDQGDFEKAEYHYNKSLEIDPNYIHSRYNKGMLLLARGDFIEGFGLYGTRALLHSDHKIETGAPVWTGQDLDGKHILVTYEQGMGDCFQFIRYLPILKRLNCKVTFYGHGILKSILETVGGIDSYICAIDPSSAYDYRISLLDIPHVLKTTVETIPSPSPYLHAAPHTIERWGAVLPKDGMKIGIAWQGNPSSPVDRGRSFPLSCFAPIAKIPGLHLISLQKRHGLDQLRKMPSVMTLGDQFDSGPDAFADTAALMMHLDLIVTSDTSIAHLAGALGRPVWVALKKVPEWRWLTDREDSPWYPTMRLFRQTTAGDWSDVFARMAVEIKRMAAHEP